MILILKGEQKLVYTTLSPAIEDAHFLFVFTSKVTGEIVKMLAPNISTSDTFQKFLFKHSENSPYGGGFILDSGDYNYEIYETRTASLNIDDAERKLAVGLMKIVSETDIPYSAEEMDIIYYNS